MFVCICQSTSNNLLYTLVGIEVLTLSLLLKVMHYSKHCFCKGGMYAVLKYIYVLLIRSNSLVNLGHLRSDTAQIATE